MVANANLANSSLSHEAVSVYVCVSDMFLHFFKCNEETVLTKGFLVLLLNQEKMSCSRPMEIEIVEYIILPFPGINMKSEFQLPLP